MVLETDTTFTLQFSRFISLLRTIVESKQLSTDNFLRVLTEYCTVTVMHACYLRSEEIVPAGLDRFVSCDSEGETDIFIPDRVDTLSER